MTAVAVTAHPAWLIPAPGVIWTVLIGFCGTPLSVLAYLYMQGRRSNKDEHSELCRLA